MTFESLIAVLGRFHPLVLHLPIGVLVGMGALELWRLIQRDPGAKLAPPILGWFAAASCVAGVATGLLLAREPAYGGDSLMIHRNLGIGLAVLSVVTACFLQAASQSRTGAWRRAYGLTLVLSMVVMIPAGHLGAGMTHGENFLFEPLEVSDSSSQSSASASARGPGAGAPSDSGRGAGIAEPPKAVMSILTARCVSCHSESKAKGGLALHDWNSIQRGGDLGPAVNVSAPEESEILRRLLLPLDDEDHMPPKSKGQPTKEEIEVIRAWLTGAPAPVAPQAAAPNSAPAAPATAPVVDSAAVEALRKRLAHVQPVSQSNPFLWIDFSAVSGADDAGVRELLSPLAGVIEDLSLARTGITDASAGFLASMPNLRRLNLTATPLTDEGVRSLAKSVSLRELNLVSTKLTDGAIESLGSMKSLERVHVWNTSISQEAIQRLRAGRSGLIAETDALEPAKPIETEAAPVLGAKPAPAQTAGALTPINTTCPVSGSPVVARYTIVHEGRVIGFCCPNCPKEFWADPAKFASKLPSKP